jgi:hypothetical protein
MTPGQRAVLERQRERTTALEQAAGRIIPWIFHRNGKAIKSFRGAWNAACRLSGVPGRYAHDFRRTAVRNLERAGVARSTAMRIVGHKTESIYRRLRHRGRGDDARGRGQTCDASRGPAEDDLRERTRQFQYKSGCFGRISYPTGMTVTHCSDGAGGGS